MIKRSKQRESIKAFLSGRTDHPTAEFIYSHLREEMPNLSLGTVYRNLALLTELGEIQKISTGIGPDHFDGNPKPHNHFTCTCCGKLIDLEMENINYIDDIAADGFPGQIRGHVTYFYGECPSCLDSHNLTKKTS